ncbi:hypothetical protein ASD15_20400 [Massilia sp. Root351]|jgi:hypothetical protein|uniref:hypothetical protein n=1 Tax=Massilia sp. Root351 TaxID=1736522 RepID=UPI00070DB667|nr:hypothetical protein [Massilia sp. Root351]KQV79032.1 hypothetical protein ASD15_20400 [Massilia sp. Root351]
MRLTILPAAATVATLVAISLGATAASTPAADPRLDGIKQIERSACVRLGNTGPGAPKNLKLVPKYCACVAKAYWDNIPKAEVDELMNNGQSAAVDQRKDQRMAAARAACQAT